MEQLVSHTEEQRRLVEWFLELIDSFREATAKLSDSERKRINNTENYSKPCQIEVIWLKQSEFQIVILSRFDDRPDREVIIKVLSRVRSS